MTGRLGVEHGERYALIPYEVLTSESFRALPDFATRVLMAHAAQYAGHHNGAVTVTASQCKDFGIRPWKSTRARSYWRSSDCSTHPSRPVEKGTKVSMVRADVA